MEKSLPSTWLLFIYKVPSGPARKRTYVWRKLTQLGALYLQQAVCLLPETEENAAELAKLAARIAEFEGQATLLRATPVHVGWQEEVVLRFQAERNREYAEIREKIGKFLDEIELEERRQRYTPGELEELEQWLEGLRRWFTKVQQRDFFAAGGAAETLAALTAAEERLEAFAAAVERIQLIENREES